MTILMGASQVDLNSANYTVVGVDREVRADERTQRLEGDLLETCLGLARFLGLGEEERIRYERNVAPVLSMEHSVKKGMKFPSSLGGRKGSEEDCLECESPELSLGQRLERPVM